LGQRRADLVAVTDAAGVVRAAEQRVAVAEERTRIARELHDSAGHAINSILIQAGAARLVQDSQPERSREAIATIEAIARETMHDLDAILGGLRNGAPADLEPLPGTDRTLISPPCARTTL
jgi:signal transduction histidine kinase